LLDLVGAEEVLLLQQLFVQVVPVDVVATSILTPRTGQEQEEPQESAAALHQQERTHRPVVVAVVVVEVITAETQGLVGQECKAVAVAVAVP
jgi:hypothetical protein